jgi:hypothetical protein
MSTSRIAGLAIAGATFLAGAAAAVPLRVVTYNVDGLPPIQGVQPLRTAEMAAIAPLLEGLHTDGTDTLVALQELFYAPYYTTLTSPPTVNYPSITAKTNDGPNFLGDGLTLLSDAPLGGVSHVAWGPGGCFGSGGLNGSDCDTNKGFLFARVTLAPGLEVDVYNLHADAGQDAGSIAARLANLTQLATAIQTQSVGRAVIVLGDTNSLYTRSTDAIASFAAGLGLDDAWVESALGGLVPGFGAVNNSGCPPPRGSAAPGPAASGSSCELVDKIFFRSGASVQISLLDYDVALNFVDGLGQPLSDHLPVAALFDITLVPEPSVAALLAVSAVMLHAARRPRAER